MRLGDIERVIVLGLGVHGEATAEALIEEGIDIRVTDSAHSPAAQDRARRLESKGAEVRFGEPDLSLTTWADLVVPSPGVPPSNPILVEAARIGLRVWSEIELGWRLTDSEIVAVTGTNGKSTTTALLTGMLQASGRAAVTAGNNWTPLVEVGRASAASTVIVCELSSFQLAFIDKFRPRIAIVTNVADDHYDWHSDHSAYLAAKARITENQTDRDLLIVKASDFGCASIAAGSAARVGAFDSENVTSVRTTAAGRIGRDPYSVAAVQDRRVFVESPDALAPVVRLENIRLPGLHNLDNVLAACLAALDLGVDMYAAAKAIESFEGLPHRTKWVAEINGVDFVDDSKATNPHATLRALEGFDRVILIAGGRAKGLDLSPLSEAKARLAGVVVTGEAADVLESVFDGIPLRRASDIEEAVVIAAEMASPGDTVLLSPAASSLDQYNDYAERGERFVKAVLSQ